MLDNTSKKRIRLKQVFILKMAGILKIIIRKLKILIPIIILLIFACKSKKTYLFKIYEGEYDELGVKSGYVNKRGDTIISLVKYYYCFTDTLKDYAIVIKHDGICVAIDKNGTELYEVYWYDNGPDYLSDGLFRIKKNKKIGYANKNGKIVIEPQFECTTPFEKGRAKVTFKCELINEGEYTRMVSNDWFYIDKKGNKLNE